MPTHVSFLATLFVVWGALTMVVGLATLSLAIAAMALMNADAARGQFAAGLVAAIFLTLAGLAIVWGLAHVMVGVPLRRRRPWSRLAALMLGSVDLVLLPYGTVLGCYTLWTLLPQPAKALFEK